jgi:1-deoxy-D-xylulose-5-phosphate reductoisomerase
MVAKVKRLAVLGSTGSIGRQTLDVVRALPGRFRVIALAAGNNLGLLEEQVAEFQPEFVSYIVRDENGVSSRFDSPGCRFLSLAEMATQPGIDTVVIATSGTAGLEATLAAAETGKNIALANKESLVIAGEIITAAAARSGALILPVDSEHSAIWQCLEGEKRPPRRIILTASGGPFLNYTKQQMAGITVAKALEHPSWRMGKKVTIDSATLMNKGLEVIEARWLFGAAIDDVTVLVHPQSIVHSMVEFADGSVKAQLSPPDMRLPIQYSLTYPERLANDSLPAFDWAHFPALHFGLPDTGRFPCLRMATEAGKKGGTFPAALCAADEVAVEFFLAGRIGFLEIAPLIERVLERHASVARPGLEEIVAAGSRAREEVMAMAGGGGR